MFVVPAPGLKIRNPDRAYQFLSETGEEVPENRYWHRRVAEGDVLPGQSANVAVNESEANT